MTNLEQTVENSFLGKVKNYIGRVRSPAISKLAVYSLAGVLSAGVGYGCGSESGKEDKDITQTPETFQPKEIQESKEEPQTVCWEKTFGGSYDDYAYSIQQTTDEGYIVAGSTESKGAGESDAWVLKIDSTGNLEWDKTFGGTENDEASSIQQTTDDGYIVAGYTNSKGKGTGTGDAWVFKLDSNGELEWNKTFGGSMKDYASSIQQTTDDGYIVASNTQLLNDRGFSFENARILKLNSNGELEWEKTFGGSSDYTATSIQQTTDLGYIVGGTKILKLDPNGELEWEKTFGESSDYTATSIQQTTDLGYIAVSTISSEESPDGFGYFSDGRIFKLDSTGELEWDKTFGGDKNDWLNSIQQTTDDGYVGTGYTVPNAWILKLDSTGELEWDKTIGGNSEDNASSIQQTKDEMYIVAGYTILEGAQGGEIDAWVFKLDKNGGNTDCE